MDDVTESKEAKVEIRVNKHIWMMCIFDWIVQKKRRFFKIKRRWTMVMNMQKGIIQVLVNNKDVDIHTLCLKIENVLFHSLF